MVMLVGIVVSLVPLALVCFLDLHKLEQWKEANLAAEQRPGCSSGCLEEPLLPKAAPGRPSREITSREILAEDGAMGHWEADAAAAFGAQRCLLVQPPVADARSGDDLI